MILIDRRAGSAELEPLISQLGAPTQIMDLDAGDFAVDGNGPNGSIMICIERKRVRDMLDSVQSGRFAGLQMPLMLSRYEQCYLIVEGRFRPGERGLLEEYSWRTKTWHPVYINRDGMTYQAFMGYLTSLESTTRLRLRQSESAEETANLVVALYHFWAKPWAHHDANKVFYVENHTGPLINYPLIRRWAKELPGVGWERSVGVAASFPNAGAMANATSADWLKVPGIGKTLSQKVRHIIWGEGG